MFSFEDKGGTVTFGGSRPGVSFAQVTVTLIQLITLGKHAEGPNTFTSTFFLFCLILSVFPYDIPKKIDFRVVNLLP